MSPLKGIGIVPIAIVLAVIVGAIAGVMVLNMARTPAEAPVEPGDAAKAEEPTHGAMVKLNDRVVNLADPAGRRYLKVGITLELQPKDPKIAKDVAKLEGQALIKKEEELGKEIAPMTPKINDIITTVLSAKSFEQIATTEGKAKLKEELKQQFGHVLTKQNVIEIYFTDFVVQ